MVKILEIKIEACPAAKLIGKKYMGKPDWGEWWANGWFDTLEAKETLPVNDDGYIGAVHIVDGMPERWIGLFFPADAEVPAGFDAVAIEPKRYAVCYLYGDAGNGELYAMDTHNLCLDALRTQGFTRKEDDWCFERYNCPRFTTPDENGNVILDYALSIE